MQITDGTTHNLTSQVANSQHKKKKKNHHHRHQQQQQQQQQQQTPWPLVRE
jgi:hypothetical protein